MQNEKCPVLNAWCLSHDVLRGKQTVKWLMLFGAGIMCYACD